jgi:hypothetical protein
VTDRSDEHRSKELSGAAMLAARRKLIEMISASSPEKGTTPESGGEIGSNGAIRVVTAFDCSHLLPALSHPDACANETGAFKQPRRESLERLRDADQWQASRDESRSSQCAIPRRTRAGSRRAEERLLFIEARRPETRDGIRWL